MFEDGSFLVTDVMIVSFLAKLRDFWIPKKGGKIESKGNRYELGDFIIKVGIVTVGPSTKGVAIEVKICWFFHGIWLCNVHTVLLNYNFLIPEHQFLCFLMIPTWNHSCVMHNFLKSHTWYAPKFSQVVRRHFILYRTCTNVMYW